MPLLRSLTASLVFILIFNLTGCESEKSPWKPAEGPLFTKWATEITTDNVLPEYPRPQLVRNDWLNLNGLWEYAITEKNTKKPEEYDGQILVPFPIESALSGVKRYVGAENALWYRKSIDIPEQWQDRERVILHFGAVDWETMVLINGKIVGMHKGGYDAFSFDITDYLNKGKEQEIIVRVWDPVDQSTQPRGKQVSKPGGIWYTSVTGIWQTVWMEPVDRLRIRSIKILPDIDQARLDIELDITEPEQEYLVMSSLSLDGKQLGQVHTGPGNDISFDIQNQQLWTPDNPVLYDVEISLMDSDGNLKDRINTYAGMRKISISRYGKNYSRIFLNNEFVFQIGPLDQGWWPDGLYTAPSDEALKYDIEVTKKLGFNMARKHVKVEPERWYYWCDKLGLLVWQDMPSGDEYIDPNEADFQRSKESAAQFELELKEIVTQFGNHPSIVIWVPFNEGWGQYETERITNYIKTLDPNRLVINTSGWADRGVGDIHDIHAYPGPAMPEPERNRAVVLGEFGGLGLPLPGHTWQSQDNWGYRNYKNKEELAAAYTNLIRDLQEMIGRGLSAAVYTQTSDVEVEVNGLMTYDRRVIKFDPQYLTQINQGYLPPIIKSRYSIFTDDATILLYNELKKGDIYYTTDGTIPDKKAQLYTKPFKITETATIKSITVYENDLKSAVSEKLFEKVNYTTAVGGEGYKEGIKYAYYDEGITKWRKLPDFKQFSATAEGISEQINIEKAKSDELFAMKFEGFVEVPKDGIYTFFTNSDDGSQLFIHDKLLVDNDYTHPMSEKSGDIALKKGKHPIRLTFFQGRGGKGLEVSYQGPGVEKQAIPATTLFHK